MNDSYFEGMLSSLANRAAISTVSLLGVASVPLRRHLLDLFSRPYGEDGCFLSDPAFEAVFGWKLSDKTMSDLSRSLLSPKLVHAMDQVPKELADEYRFPLDRNPYAHQLETWEALRCEPPKSVIVTSGTGSGKTECFMVPILDSLVRENEALGNPLVGVRALFLYPLNALINSQRDRLRAWTATFKGDIRFCLYNGLTPDRAQGHVASASPSEVLDRRTLRASPPPVLVTNATMLEYMLVRAQDEPILRNSHGKLRWIVLDEAHSYIGSQAAEISLLIRRVMHAFGVSPDVVRFVATSATIGDPKGEAGQQLRGFLAQLAGVNASRVHLVAGERAVPGLPHHTKGPTLSLDDLRELDGRESSAPNRYAALCRSDTARRIRDEFTRAGRPTVARLSEVCSLLGEGPSAAGGERQQEALKWLDLLSATTSEQGERFLPLRAHLFHQTLTGIWACADVRCSHKGGTALSDEHWPFGAVYLAPRQHCACGAPAFELVTCDDCASVYLCGEERGGRVLQPRGWAATDDFELAGDQEPDSEDEPEAECNRAGGSESGYSMLIANRPLPGTGLVWVRRADRSLCEGAADDALALQVAEQNEHGLSCPNCGADNSGGRLFRHARIGAPFLLGGVLPTLLEFASDGARPMEKPYRGRRLLTFSDSRQGTARTAARLQQDAERTTTRGLIYHYALQVWSAREDGTACRLEEEIRTLQAAADVLPHADTRAPLVAIIEGMRRKLAELRAGQPIEFSALQRSIAHEGTNFPSMLKAYRGQGGEIFSGDMGALALAGMLIVREFGRRPKRLNSLETMGMVSVQYPKLRQVAVAPAPWKQRGQDEAQWRDFLKICLDFFVRSGGSLEYPDTWRNWLGVRFPRKWLVAPDAKELGLGQRRWPQAARTGASSLLVRLLAGRFDLDPQSDYGKDSIDELLRCAWDELKRVNLLSLTNSGYVLKLEDLAFAPMPRGKVCPVTRRILDVTLDGVSPYVPRGEKSVALTCESVEIPVYERAFGDEVDAIARLARARRWLSEQSGLAKLRDEGLWSDANDRVIELAPFFVSAEHSAQQPADRLQRYEKEFKEGYLNLLSCSTTMEMGIDIGGVQIVAMNNVPPHPANYLQRAGRAGRRREARSASVTLCKSNPHDQNVFLDSRWAFQTKLPAPIVSLNSAVIVQRHVNAMVLSDFLRKISSAGGQDLTRLTCGWFFAESDPPPAERFSDWCLAFHPDVEPALCSGLKQLVRHSVFEGQDPTRFLRRAGDAMREVVQRWRAEWTALSSQESAAVAAGPLDPAVKAIALQKRRMSLEYLLRELCTDGFLPAYGFPSNIAAFDNLTVAEAKKLRAHAEGDAGRDDNRFKKRDLASRDIVTALREYAPGSEIVMDGLVYRSAGVTLNWHVPASQQDARETQAIRYAWRCRRCGASGASMSLEAARGCDACGAEVRSSDIQSFLEPAGFAVDFYSEPHNDVSAQRFVPVERPWITARGDWSLLPNPNLGRLRATTTGGVYHHSSGPNGKGYALCLACGRAEPMLGEGVAPDSLKPGVEHYRLRSTKTERICSGSYNGWAIKEGISLGHFTRTDVLEVRLRDRAANWILDRTAAMTIAVAMRDALADLLGVQVTELGCDVQETRDDNDERCQSIFLFDRYAAGYASSGARLIADVLKAAASRLRCPKDCDSCCPHCVLDFDQRFEAENLDRHAALRILTEDWLNALKLPEELRFFGDSSQVEDAPLAEAVLREAARGGAILARLFVDGASDAIDVAVSGARLLAYHLAATARPVEIVIEKGAFDAMGEDDLFSLASVADHPGIKVALTASTPFENGATICAEVIQETGAVKWGAADRLLNTFGPNWGRTSRPIVTASRLTPVALALEPLASRDIRPVRGGDMEISVHHELDGPLQGFGARFWRLLSIAHPRTHALLVDGTDEIKAVRYSDRYLFAPLSVALVLELVTALRNTVGHGRWAVERCDITTAELRPGGANKSFSRVYSDWGRSEDRDRAMMAAFDYVGTAAKIDSSASSAVRHGRYLEVELAGGACLTVRFDQGISYWRAADHPRGVRSEAVLYDFGGRGGAVLATDEEIRDQGKRIAEMRVRVEGGAFPTEVFVKVRGI